MKKSGALLFCEAVLWSRKPMRKADGLVFLLLGLGFCAGGAFAYIERLAGIQFSLFQKATAVGTEAQYWGVFFILAGVAMLTYGARLVHRLREEPVSKSEVGVIRFTGFAVLLLILTWLLFMWAD